MRNHPIVTTLVILAAIVALAGAAAAQNRLAKLPAAYTLPQTGDSPGRVTFNHESHVDADAPNCTSCHPKLFKILAPGATADGKPITHASMDKGQSCGGCHNGKTTFGFDDCTLCHR
jgi:c(7)-type cytochrome triheme protein